MQSGMDGYVSIGIGGSSMRDAGNLFVCFGGCACSQRSVGGHYMPVFNSAVSTVSTPASVSRGGLECTIQVDGLGSGFGYIWAVGASGPAGSASGDFGFHNERGTGFLQIVQAPVAPPSPPSSEPSSSRAADVEATTTSSASSASAIRTISTRATGMATGTATALATATVAASAQQASSKYCADSKGSFCVSASRSSELITFTVYSSQKGWVGIGTGSLMAGSTMFVGWNNANGSAPVVSQRSASGHVMPTPDSASVFTLIETPKSLSLPATTALSFTFTVPISAKLVSTTGPSQFMYGVSDAAPTAPSNPSSPFPQHSSFGAFTLDVSKLGLETTGDVQAITQSTLIFAHSLVMFIAWGVLPFAGIFVARYMKQRWEKSWYAIHWCLMLFGTGALTVAGLVAVEVNLGDGVARFTKSSHAVAGAVLALGVYPAQVILGFVINALFDVERVAVPWWDHLHAWLGRLSGVLALVVMQLGLSLYGSSVGIVVGFWVWIVVVLVVGFGYFGERVLGASQHVVEEAASADSLKV
ncbi:hypothetical protein HDU78_004178 [Chytriomyces hyalinus]|nr:hypothetical protein HDU78_004178 [Chytriomyces hyalinus]